MSTSEREQLLLKFAENSLKNLKFTFGPSIDIWYKFVNSKSLVIMIQKICVSGMTKEAWPIISRSD